MPLGLDDAVLGWLVSETGTRGARRIRQLVVGDEQEQALRKVVGRAIPKAAAIAPAEERERLQRVLVEWQAPKQEPAEAAGLHAVIWHWVQPLTDAVDELDGQSYLSHHGVAPAGLVEALEREIRNGIEDDAVRGGPLKPIAERLRHDHQVRLAENIQTDVSELSGKVAQATRSEFSVLLTQLLEAREFGKRGRRQWLSLENGFFPSLRDTDATRASFLATLRDALVESFGDQAAQFVMVLSVGATGSTDVALSFYSVWSHQRKFVALATQRHRELMSRIIDARMNASDVEAVGHDLRQQFAETEQATADWRVECNAVFAAVPIPHLITYEPAFCRVRIEVRKPLNADPAEYDEKVTTASEALSYACSLAGQPAANIGDLSWYSGNQALVKLASYILDRRELDFTRFRIAMDDPETWDFRYPEPFPPALGGALITA